MLVPCCRRSFPVTPATVRLDLAKNVFRVHVADVCGYTIDSKRLTRRELLPFLEALPPCLIGIEACATAHNWARQLLEYGHDVRLIPPDCVEPLCGVGRRIVPFMPLPSAKQ